MKLLSASTALRPVSVPDGTGTVPLVSSQPLRPGLHSTWSHQYLWNLLLVVPKLPQPSREARRRIQQDIGDGSRSDHQLCYYMKKEEVIST